LPALLTAGFVWDEWNGLQPEQRGFWKCWLLASAGKSVSGGSLSLIRPMANLRHSHCAFPFRNADSTLTSFRHALEDIYGECAALQICDFIVQATGNDACERSFLFGHNDFKTESEFLEAVGLALQRLPEDFAGRPQIVISSGFRHVLGAASIRYLGSKESNNVNLTRKLRASGWPG
jgi:hypothetical protein